MRRVTMRYLLCLAIVLLFSGSVHAQVPALNPIPHYLAKGVRDSLVDRAKALKEQLDALKALNTDVKDNCVDVPEHSPKAEECGRKQTALESGKTEYVKKVNEFNQSLEVAIEDYLGKDAVARYKRLKQLYNFCDLSEIDNVTPLNQIQKENLEYLVRNVAPKLDNLDDALVVAWWATIEGVLQKEGGPWAFTNCGEQEENVITLDCTAKYWQIGYGLQAKDARNRQRLREVFRRFYPGKVPRDIGQQVLQKAGMSNLKFPDADWSILTNAKRLNNIRDSGKSNYFWASILMRDPVIGAYLEAKIIKEDFNCYWPDKKHSSGCGTYAERREKHSAQLLAVLKAWSDIK